MKRRRDGSLQALLAFALLVALPLIPAACGRNPAAPSRASGPIVIQPPSPLGGGLPFQNARYILSIADIDLECADVKSPQGTNLVHVVVAMKADATGWTATAETGTFTLRIQPGNASVPLPQVSLAGTVSGFMDDQVLPFTPPTVPLSGTRVTITDAIPFTGVLLAPTPEGLVESASGTFDGAVVFSRSPLISTCPAGQVRWTMVRNIFF